MEMTLDLYKKQIAAIDERIAAFNEHIKEAKHDKIKCLYNFIDYRSKYVKFDTKYIYVKTQFTHESILTDEPIIVLRGIGFDVFQLKIEKYLVFIL